jgi:chloride channel, nucleotide-sensitive, 1A
MQIELGEDGGYEEDGPWELTVIPSAVQEEQPDPSSPTAVNMPEPTSTTPPQETITALFTALSACSNLHPDPTPSSPTSSNNEDPVLFEGSVGYESQLPGALPPPFPGSSGWITAENVGEYFDEEGGLKKRRGRGEEDHGGEEGEEEGEGKWRRTG